MHPEPMDQHLKCSPNNSLLARRRNKTASIMLQERLENLEEKYHRGYRQFLRERSRVQSEMRELQDISSLFDEKLEPEVALKKAQFHNLAIENHPTPFTGHQGFQNLTNQQRQSPLKPRKEGRTRITRTALGERLQHSDSSAKIVNTHYQLSKEGKVQGRKVKETVDQSSTVPSSDIRLYEGHMTPFVSPVSTDCTNSGENLQHAESSFTESSSSTGHSTKTSHNERIHKTESTNYVGSPRRSSVPSSRVFCKFNSQPHSRFPCHHFPCVTPATYHTIGRRISNVGHYDSLKSSATRSTSTDTKLLPMTHTTRSSGYPTLYSSLSTNSSLNAIEVAHNQHPKELPLTGRWNINSSKQSNQLKVTSFKPLPPDPILERVRSGSKKTAELTDNRTRTSIKDKVRGLNQLSSEMRARNDRMKPQDWTVNYGQKIPLRKLLNPGLPR